MKSHKITVRNGALSLAMASALSACAVTPTPLTQTELAQQGKDDRAQMFAQSAPLTKPLTLADAIARALSGNLDKRSKMMDEALALGLTKLDQFDLLPKLTANAGYSDRSNPAASHAKDLYTGAVLPGDPTYIVGPRSDTADLTLSWNILDFGVSYVTAHQDADRALIATERRRKAVNNLVQDVRYAFWRAAAYQLLEHEVDKTVTDAHAALKQAGIMERENLKAPSEILRFQRSLLETLRQLTAIEQDLSTAPLELASLINLPVGSTLVLDVPDTLVSPLWQMSLDDMEEVAFTHNPDLHEQAYLSRIAVNDTRKAILKMLPGLSFSGGRNYDANNLLLDQTWYQAGSMLSWNLINLVSGPSSISYAETNETAVEARRMAVRMAVLAQVHVSERQFRNAGNQFVLSDALWHVDKRLAEISDAETINNAQGMLEHVAEHASAISSQVRRFQSFAMVEQAYAKIMATLGRDLVPESTDAQDLPALTTLISTRLKDLETGSDDPRPAGTGSDNAVSPK